MQEKPGGDFYSVDKAAKLPGGTPERIRQMLRAGQLMGEQEGADPHAPWKVHQTSVEAHRDRAEDTFARMASRVWRVTSPPSTCSPNGAEEALPEVRKRDLAAPRFQYRRRR